MVEPLNFDKMIVSEKDIISGVLLFMALDHLWDMYLNFRQVSY